MTSRKSDHITISLEKEVEAGTSGLEGIELVHCALPELDYAKIDLSTELFGKKLKYPLIIEAMTGGTEEAMMINGGLSIVAKEMGIGLAVGSQRPAIENKTLEKTFNVINDAGKGVLKIANLGAVQLNYGYGPNECQRAIDMIGADALALHLNPLQEVIQPEGNTNFSNLLPKIADVCSKVSVPVIAKEVGCGLSRQVAEKLIGAGVQCLDVGGYGGTSWNRIEAYRADGAKKGVSKSFDGWGIPTAMSLMEVTGLPAKKIASGGIRSGLDAAKAIALGADAVGMALPVLKALDKGGEEGAVDYLQQVAEELRLAMFLTGSKDLESLMKAECKVFGKAKDWLAEQ